jgi:hypothetical protein
VFDFQNEQELQMEIVKRSSTVKHMEESQADYAAGGAFAYPFTESNGTALYGPRVNYAAREYWEPAVPDNYANRDTKANAAKNAKLLHSKRPDRYHFYGDQDAGYGWKLSKKGQTDPYKAVALLFTPQSQPRLRSLLHCDYLVSLVNMLSLADAIGPAAFNDRVRVFGVDQFVLRWNAFQDLHAITYFRDKEGEFAIVKDVGQLPKPGLRTTQRVRPSSPADLIIGDHVVFFNHLAYDLLNERIRNAWRLENAVLIRRGAKGDPKDDVFLGHGSGKHTGEELRKRLADEYNTVASLADGAVKRAKSKDKKTQASGMTELRNSFPNINLVGSEFRVQGIVGGCKYLDEPFEKLKHISPKDVVGPFDPCIPTLMYVVERPIESAK